MCATADYYLQDYLQRLISTLPINEQIQLRSIRNCAKSAIPQIGQQDRVYVVRNEKSAKFFGLQTCGNPFACPVCSAKIMNKHARKIAASIDGLNAKGKKAIMITFTVPHHKIMTCNQVTDLLYLSWKRMFQKRKTKSLSTVKKFTDYFHNDYIIKACEYTYGKNGWHPHFHALFFVDADKFDLLLDWEQSLREYWVSCYEYVAKKLLSDTIYKAFRAISDNQKKSHFGFYMSKTPEGKPLETTSSAYISGWTTDQELTGNVLKKASHDNHYTPHQILEMAANGNEEFERLYIEFLLQVTRKPVHHRIDYSKGLKAIYTNTLNQKGYQEVLKKKRTDGDWESFCWFTKFEFQEISYSGHRNNILYLASINRKDLLADFLREVFDFDLHDEKLEICRFVEDILNDKVA